MSTHKSRRDATVQALVNGMARGRAKRVRVRLPASKAAEAKLSDREKVLRARGSVARSTRGTVGSASRHAVGAGQAISAVSAA